MDPNTNVPVNESAEFCCMFSLRLAGTELLYCAEMDGIESSQRIDWPTVNLNELRFVELKVNKSPRAYWQREQFGKHKLRNWWCQSVLAGIQNIIVGERDEPGIVNKLNELKVKDLPAMGRVSRFFRLLTVNKLGFDFMFIILLGMVTGRMFAIL